MYTIKSFAKIIGLEPHQIRKLEEVLKIDLGIRDENGYRNYDIGAAFEINSLLALCSMGFTRKEALDIINGEIDNDEIIKMVETKTEEMIQEEVLLNRKIANNKLFLSLNETFEEASLKIEKLSMDSLYFLTATRKNESLEPAEQLDEEIIKELVHNIPLTIIGSKISEDDYELGYFIFGSDISYYKINNVNLVKYEGEGCLRFLCRLNEGVIEETDLKRINDYAQENGYILGKEFFVDCMNGRNLGYQNYFLTYVMFK